MEVRALESSTTTAAAAGAVIWGSVGSVLTVDSIFVCVRVGLFATATRLLRIFAC